jgi:hypothetical protein
MSIPWKTIGSNESKKAANTLRTGGYVVTPPPEVAPRFYARIVGYHSDADAYDVMSLGLGGLIAPGARFNDISRVTNDPNEHTILEIGTTVLVDRAGGTPQITGVSPVNADPRTVAGLNLPDLGGEETSTEQPSTSFFGKKPKGMLPGDWVQATEDGNYFALLRKGINRIYANKRTQFIMSRIGDFTGLYTQNFIFRSIIGDLQIGEQNGEGFLKFDAGFDILNDVAYKATKYSLGVALGHAAKKIAGAGQDCIAALVIKDPESKAPVSGIYFTNKGRIKFLAHAGFDFVAANKGDFIQEFGGGYQTRINKNEAKHVRGSSNKNIEGQEEKTVGSNKYTTIGNDEYIIINRNKVETIQGNYTLTIKGGNVIPSLPTVNGYEIQCINNNYVVEVSRNSLQPIPLKMGFYMHNGEIIIGENPLMPAKNCTVSINTLKPGMINLGGTLLKKPMNAPVLHNELMEWLTTMLTTFDSHTHPTAWGPSGVPLAPASPSLSPKIPLLRSTFVSIFA